MSLIDDEEDKFESIYLQYRYLMLNIANKILRNHHDAEDTVHQAFLSVVQNWEKFFAERNGAYGLNLKRMA